MKFYLLICILVFTLEIVKIASLSLLVSSLGKVYIKAVLAIFERQLPPVMPSKMKLSMATFC
jgi:hypothetical protein